MIEEIHVFGIYLPAALVWAMLALIITFLLRDLLQRLPLDRFLWHPALLELAVFVTIWWALVWLGDGLLPHGLIF